MRTGLAWIIAGLLVLPAWQSRAASVDWIKVNGVIGPATASYIARAIDQAKERQAEALVIELDTPGGLLDSTKEIVQAFYASTVPVVVYVAPSGANAGSAGCFITLAADVAAMAPNTSIGAAHPVMIGGGQGESKPDEVMKQKLENFATSYIEAIATKRNRNVEWAKSAVRDSASITSEKALELKVIEIIAKDSSDLLQQLDGRETDHGVLRTAGATIRPNPMLLREQIFQVLGRPEVMFILMLVAVYGLIGELSNPGAILPGVVGLIALIVSLYLSTILPINIAGFALILLAVALFIADAFVSAHGILTIGGVVSFFLGALMLFETAEPLYRLSLGLIIPATVLTALFFLFVAGAGLRAQLWPVKVGRETIVGKEVRTVTKIDATSGKVLFEGEYWNAISDTPIESGAFVEIIGRTGLTLKVKPKTPTPT